MKSEQSTNSTAIIAQTAQWIAEVIIVLNFCPFAKKVFDQQLIFYKVVESKKLEQALATLIDECMRLDVENKIETTMIIYPNMLGDFNDYLDFLELANQLLESQNYIGIYQLASFHPNYCFDGAEAAENYTNRSPYPMLHLLRESSLNKALETYPHPEQIPVRNVKLAEQKGTDYFKKILTKIKNLK